MRRACSLLSASGVYAPFRLVLFNICSDATKPCRPIYVQTRCPMWGPSRQSRLPDETLGEMKAGGRKDGRKAHTGVGRGGRVEEDEDGKQAPKNNEAKSEDKRGAISVAGFMYCQHYPRY